MIRWNLFFEVEKVEQLALIDHLATHHDRPPSLKASRKRNHDSSISTRPFSTGSTLTGHKVTEIPQCSSFWRIVCAIAGARSFCTTADQTFVPSGILTSS